MSTLLLEGKITVPDGVLVRELSGESVVLNLNGESYFGLDEVGTRMWAVLATAHSIDATFNTLLAEYDVEPELLRADLDKLIHKLVGLGLLHVHAE